MKEIKPHVVEMEVVYKLRFTQHARTPEEAISVIENELEEGATDFDGGEVVSREVIACDAWESFE